MSLMTESDVTCELVRCGMWVARAPARRSLTLSASAAEAERRVGFQSAAALGNENEGDRVENVRVHVGSSTGEALGNAAPERPP